MFSFIKFTIFNLAWETIHGFRLVALFSQTIVHLFLFFIRPVTCFRYFNKYFICITCLKSFPEMYVTNTTQEKIRSFIYFSKDWGKWESQCGKVHV